MTDEVQRVINVHDLPCGHCGGRYGDHDSYRKNYCCPTGDTVFCHAETPPIEPASDNEQVGHLYRDYCGGHLMRIARKVTYVTPRGGIDFELEPIEVNPESDATWRAHRKLVSGRAINATFHHSRKCPCGGGYAR